MTHREKKTGNSPFDIVVHNGTIVTVNGDFDIINDGIVCIKDGIIRHLSGSTENRLPPARQLIDADGGIIMPGLVNAHTHLPMSLFRGMADDLPLSTWLNEHIFPAESRYLSPATVHLGTLISCTELLLSGTTTCCDAYFFEDAVAKAVFQSGLRAVLSQAVIDFPAPGVPDPTCNIDESSAFIGKWENAAPAITPSIFCHSPYTCSAATLKKAKKAADHHQVLFQIHAAETRTEWEQIHHEHGVSPIQYLADLGILDSNTLLVHAVWMDEKDIVTIAAHGCGIAHNPSSNMKLSSGIAPIPGCLKNNIRTGLGTDGCASNNTLDLFTEMDLAAKLHKAHHLDPTVMDAQTIIKMATVDGARAIGLGEHIGSLEPGKQADLIIIDTCTPHLTPMYHPASHIVYAVTGSDVRDVIIGGKQVVGDRKLLTIDIEPAMHAMNALSERLTDS